MADPNNPNGPNGIFIHPDADTSSVRNKFLDLSYGFDSVSQRLDIYLPNSKPTADGYPLVIFIHGGAWMMCDKKDIQLIPVLKAVEQGYAVASLNYRLSSEAVFPSQIYDIKAAVRWLRANHGQFSLNTNKIAVWGASSGAHLAALLGTSYGIDELEDLSMGNPEESSAAQAVVAWFCPTDFLKMDEYLRISGTGIPDHSSDNSPEALLLGNKITEVPEKVKQANPETWLRADTPPFLLQHGDADEIVPHQMSAAFAEKIRKIADSDRVEFTTLHGAMHADPAFEKESNVDIVLNFIRKHI